jgi:hypothetical protein
MIVRENHQNCSDFTVATGTCCLRKTGSCFCNLSFHKVFVLKNITAESVNSRTWQSALVFAGKSVWCKGVLMAQGMWHTVIPVHGCSVTQALYVWLTFVWAIIWQICHEAEVYGCNVEGRCGHPRYSACATLLPVWTCANCGCLATEMLVCLWKAGHVLRNVWHTFKDNPPLSTQIDRSCFKCVDFTLCSGTVLVRCFICQSVLPCCSILPKIRKGIWKFFPALPVDLPRLRTAVISSSSASRCVLLLSGLFLQVRII